MTDIGGKSAARRRAKMRSRQGSNSSSGDLGLGCLSLTIGVIGAAFLLKTCSLPKAPAENKAESNIPAKVESDKK